MIGKPCSKTMILSAILLSVAMNGQVPDSGRIYTNLAATCLSTGRYDEAVKQYQNVLRFRPGHAAATYNIACAYSLNNQPDQALEWLSKAVDLGLYSFDGDTDLDNIRSTKRYQDIKNRADKLLKTLKTQVREPVVQTPDRLEPGQTYPLLVAMHGWGGNPVDFSANLKSVADRRGYIVCCPYGPDVMGKTTFGWGVDTTAERVVIETLAKMTAKYPIDQARVVLLGFSQGGGYSFYLGLKHADLFLGVMPVAAAYYDTSWNQYLAHAREKGLRFHILLGGDEPAERREANLAAIRTLIENGISVSFNVFAGFGHTLPGDAEYEIGRGLDALEHYRK